jgi:hypothetical protein
MHGGAAGSGAPIGNKNALRHGHYTAEAIARRRGLAELIRQSRATLAELDFERAVETVGPKASGRHLLRHNCTGTGGVSGAPLLTEKGGKWYVAGIDVAAETGVASGVAVVPDEVRKQF